MSAWEDIVTVCVRARNRAVHDVVLHSVATVSLMAVAMLAPWWFASALGLVLMPVHAGIVGASLAWALQWHREAARWREGQGA